MSPTPPETDNQMAPEMPTTTVENSRRARGNRKRNQTYNFSMGVQKMNLQPIQLFSNDLNK